MVSTQQLTATRLVVNNNMFSFTFETKLRERRCDCDTGCLELWASGFPLR